MEKQSPVQRIWELGKGEHGRLITAVIFAEKKQSPNGTIWPDGERQAAKAVIYSQTVRDN